MSECFCLLTMCLLPEIAFAQNLQAGAPLGGLEILREEREILVSVTTNPQPTQHSSSCQHVKTSTTM